MKTEHPARRAARSLRDDMKWSWNAFVRNTLAGSPLIPRLLRALIYRLAGYRFETVNISAGAIFNNGSVSIGRETAIARACYFEGRAAVTIGEDCMIGPEVAFLTSTHEVELDGSFDRTAAYRPITVGAHSWVGARATLLPGTTIGEHVVVAAGAVVRGDCPSGYVYGGVPARQLCRVEEIAERKLSLDDEMPAVGRLDPA